MSIKMFLLLTKHQLVSISDHKPLLKIFTGHTNNDKCNTWGLEAASSPRHFKVQHTTGIANVLVNSVSRLRAVGLYHDLNFKEHTQEFSAPFEPLPPVEPMIHTPLKVNEVFITPNIEKLMQNYNTLHDLTTAHTDKTKVSLENASPADI